MHRIRRHAATAGAALILGMLSLPALATAQTVPEPSTLLILAGGVAAAIAVGVLRGRK